MGGVKAMRRDTIAALFWNPPFWRKDEIMESLPEASLPDVRETAKRAAKYIRDRHARDAAINGAEWLLRTATVPLGLLLAPCNLLYAVRWVAFGQLRHSGPRAPLLRGRAGS